LLASWFLLQIACRITMLRLDDLMH
jgi:hypothetical protein